MITEKALLEQRLEEAYHRIAEYHKRLCEFFGVEDKRGPPRVATSGLRYDGLGIMMFPNPAFYNPKKWLIKFSAFPFYFKSATYLYESWNNYVFIKKKNLLESVSEYSTYAEAHEATHSVISPKKAHLKVDEEDIKSLKGDFAIISDWYLKEKEERKNDLFSDFKNLRIGTAEFFAPIGTTYLRSQLRRFDWRRHIDRPWEVTLELVVEHLPQLAGELLVDQYHRDVRALMREHPQLPHLNGHQIWKQYCLPLLKDGRLK